MRYAAQQLLEFPTINSELTEADIAAMPAWDDPASPLATEHGKMFLEFLESAGVFFSSPLDLDFSMLTAFPQAFGVDDSELEPPEDEVVRVVLGKAHGPLGLYDAKQRTYFDAYRSRFKVQSKPVRHIAALSLLTDEKLNLTIPKPLDRMIASVATRLAALPE